MDRNKFAVALTTFVLGIVVLTVVSALSALPVMWLWNGIIPNLFGLKTIDWSQAWALQLLCTFLFKTSFGYNSDK